MTLPNCSRGESNAEPDVGTLKANFRGNDYMIVWIIFLKGLRWVVMTKYLHTLKPNTRHEQYLKIKNI